MSTEEALREQLAALLDQNHTQPYASGKAYASLCTMNWVKEAVVLLTHEDTQLVQLLANQMIQGEDETQIREYAFFLPRIHCKNQRRAMELTQTIRLSNLPWSDDYSNKSLHVQEQCIAMINVVDAIDEITRGRTTQLNYQTPQHSVITSRHTLIPVLNDPEMIHVITTTPATAEDMVSLMRENRVTDHRILQALISGITPALASGNL